MWSVIAGILAALLPKLLTAIWQRQDVTDAVKWKLYQQMDAVTTEAMAWKAAAFADPARAARVRYAAGGEGLRPGEPDPDPPDGAR